MELVYGFKVREEDGAYIAQGIEYPSAITQALSKQELSLNIKDALETVLLCELQEGNDIVKPSEKEVDVEENGFVAFTHVNLDDLMKEVKI